MFTLFFLVKLILLFTFVMFYMIFVMWALISQAYKN